MIFLTATGKLNYPYLLGKALASLLEHEVWML